MIPIKKLCAEHHMPVRELARMTRIKREDLRRLETGHIQPRPDQLARLANTLGIPPEELQK